MKRLGIIEVEVKIEDKEHIEVKVLGNPFIYLSLNY